MGTDSGSLIGELILKLVASCWDVQARFELPFRLVECFTGYRLVLAGRDQLITLCFQVILIDFSD